MKNIRKLFTRSVISFAKVMLSALLVTSSASALEIKDAAQRTIGSVVGFGSNGALVLLKVGSRKVIVELDRGGFYEGITSSVLSTARPTVVFESTDCSGQPLMANAAVSRSPFFVRSAVLGENKALYVHMGEPAVMINPKSQRLTAGAESACRELATVKQKVYPLTFVVNLEDEFPTPYSATGNDIVDLAN